MAKKLLASLLIVLAVSFVFANLGYSQSAPKTKQYRQRRMIRGIDDGMVKQAPRIGDEQMARKAPENTDNGIFKPRGAARMYRRMTKSKSR